MPTSNKPDAAIRVIQKEVRYTETLSINYLFYIVTTGASVYYAVEILLNGEAAMQMLGSDEMRAQRLFEIMVNECVTPCTLADILHDLGCEEDGRLHLQNLCKM